MTPICGENARFHRRLSLRFADRVRHIQRCRSAISARLRLEANQDSRLPQEYDTIPVKIVCEVRTMLEQNQW